MNIWHLRRRYRGALIFVSSTEWGVSVCDAGGRRSQHRRRPRSRPAAALYTLHAALLTTGKVDEMHLMPHCVNVGAGRVRPSAHLLVCSDPRRHQPASVQTHARLLALAASAPGLAHSACVSVTAPLERLCSGGNNGAPAQPTWKCCKTVTLWRVFACCGPPTASQGSCAKLKVTRWLQLTFALSSCDTRRQGLATLPTTVQPA